MPCSTLRKENVECSRSRPHEISEFSEMPEVVSVRKIRSLKLSPGQLRVKNREGSDAAPK